MTELTNLWESTRNLYTRFDVTITQDATALVFSEETKELLAAQASEPAVNVAEEAADVIVTAIGRVHEPGRHAGATAGRYAPCHAQE